MATMTEHIAALERLINNDMVSDTVKEDAKLRLEEYKLQHAESTENSTDDIKNTIKGLTILIKNASGEAKQRYEEQLADFVDKLPKEGIESAAARARSLTDEDVESAHKYTLGDKYRSDFDTNGLIEAAKTVNDSWSKEDLEKLHTSLEDMNYHSSASMLWSAIKNYDDKKKKDIYLAEFHKSLKETEQFETGGSVTSENSELIKKIQAILDKRVPKFHTGIREYKTFFGGETHISIFISAGNININNVRGQQPQIVSLDLNPKTWELTTQVFGGNGGQSIYREPNMEDPKEKYLAMQSVKVPFRKPKPNEEAVLDAIAKFSQNYKDTLKKHKDVLKYKDIVNYDELLKDEYAEGGTVDKKEYDFSFVNENVIEEYKYRGFNIKIAAMPSRFGQLYYGISDYGEPVTNTPTLWKTIDEAKKEIEKYIDSCKSGYAEGGEINIEQKDAKKAEIKSALEKLSDKELTEEWNKHNEEKKTEREISRLRGTYAMVLANILFRKSEKSKRPHVNTGELVKKYYDDGGEINKVEWRGKKITDNYHVKEIKIGKKEWFIDAYENPNTQDIALNVYEKYGNSQQPIFYGRSSTQKLGFDFSVPEKVRKAILDIYMENSVNPNKMENGGDVGEKTYYVYGVNGEEKKIVMPIDAYDFEIGERNNWFTYFNPNKKDEDGYDYLEVVDVGFEIDESSIYKKGGEIKMERPKEFYTDLKVKNGYEWVGFWDGYHHFTKKEKDGYLEIRAKDEDIDNGNLEYMAETNTTFADGGFIGKLKHYSKKGFEAAKQATKKGIEHTKQGYGKAKDYTNKKIHDQKKKVALNVLEETRSEPELSKEQAQIVHKADNIVESKYKDGGYIHEDHKQYCDKGTSVQSILFDKDKFNLLKARSFLKKHGYKLTKFDKTKNTYRFRQESPTHFDKESFRTIPFGDNTGIQAVIACAKPKYRHGGDVDCGCDN